MYPSRSFIYLDGDDVGARIELLLLRDDVEGAADVSHGVVRAIGEVADCIRAAMGGTVVFAAGDEVLAYVPERPSSEELDLIRDRFCDKTGLTISCGVGDTAAEAARNLHLAKLQGKNRTAGLLQS